MSSLALPTLGCVRAICTRGDGAVFVCTDAALYTVAPAGELSLIAGHRHETGLRDGVGGEARLNKPCGIAFYPDGSLILSDTYNHCLRRVSPQGEVSTFAGSGVGGLVDGIGLSARFNYPWSVVADRYGALFVSDHGNNCIRRVTPADGTVITISGCRQGHAGYADGDSASARYRQPTGLAFDVAGNLVLADSGNSCIRRIAAADGSVVTLAGGGGIGGNAGEGFLDGGVEEARFRYPFAVAVDARNAVLVADGHNHRLRVIDPEGGGADLACGRAAVTTLVGSSQKGCEDGLVGAALLNIPWALALDPRGRLVVAELGNHGRLRVLDF